jgi:hypothetical protein
MVQPLPAHLDSLVHSLSLLKFHVGKQAVGLFAALQADVLDRAAFCKELRDLLRGRFVRKTSNPYCAAALRLRFLDRSITVLADTIGCQWLVLCIVQAHRHAL